MYVRTRPSNSRIVEADASMPPAYEPSTDALGNSGEAGDDAHVLVAECDVQYALQCADDYKEEEDEERRFRRGHRQLGASSSRETAAEIRLGLLEHAIAARARMDHLGSGSGATGDTSSGEKRLRAEAGSGFTATASAGAVWEDDALHQAAPARAPSSSGNNISSISSSNVGADAERSSRSGDNSREVLAGISLGEMESGDGDGYGYGYGYDGATQPNLQVEPGQEEHKDAVGVPEPPTPIPKATKVLARRRSNSLGSSGGGGSIDGPTATASLYFVLDVESEAVQQREQGEVHERERAGEQEGEGSSHRGWGWSRRTSSGSSGIPDRSRSGTPNTSSSAQRDPPLPSERA